ncbi:MAG: translation initiation factor IF-2 [Halobacteriovoraceae bacterium]|nr:translation initiation factor IF-2 [Halobacteriovoraceae bacterium]
MPKKIFELAKDLDMSSIDLVEDLKGRGYSVRNHMTTLTEEDVQKILAVFAQEKEEKEVAAKKTKKKTKKKSATKKAKKKVAAGSASATKKSASKKKKTTKAKGEEAEAATVLKKKTVIRRKTNPADEVAVQEPDEFEQIEAGAVEAGAPVESERQEGLQVVSRPEQVAVKEDASTEKEVFKEKVHKFTPVFIPEKKAKTEAPKAEEKRSEANPNDPNAAATSSTDESGEGKKDKKRLGGLASMMSGKKVSQTRSQVLSESRSESELKSYASLSGQGRPIYTQVKRKRIFSGASKGTEVTEVKGSKRVIYLHDGGSITEVAKKLSIKAKDLIDQLLDINLLVKSDDYVGIELAGEIAALYDYRVENRAFDEDDVLGKETLTDEQKSKFPLRNPIITIMGHVDHGKTTLVDHIRNSKVADGEAGGITQHIGAYSVKVGEQTLTFLDTPGHAAFASMRQRGADITDIVVLVVAADDGVMPQTKESVRFCELAGKPIIVAINKMDKEGANPDRVKQELTEVQLTAEDWGGETQMIPVSALKGEGIDNLLEAIALQAEMMDLRADPKGSGEGVVIESKIEQGRGPVATVLIQTGTLKKGSSIVVGETYGRARNMTDSFGKAQEKAGPSMPIQILGLNEAPIPGDVLNIVKNEREAKKIVSNRAEERKMLSSGAPVAKVSLEDFFAASADSNIESKSLNLVVRSDVQGSFEAIKQSLAPLGNKEVEVKVIGGGVGPISDSDVNLASSADGFILGFNMRPVTSARKLAETQGVDIKTYSVIYELINDIKLAMEGLLDPDFTEVFIGRAEVKETFSVPRAGIIAGSVVIDGKIAKGCNIRLLREGKIMFDGKMSSLKRFKDDAKEVKAGVECGIGLEDYNDVKVGDLFEAYMMEERKRTLEEVAAAELAAAAEAEKEAARLAAIEAAAVSEEETTITQ